MGTPADKQPSPADLEAQLAALRADRERDRHALEVLYHVSLACRGQTSDRAIFDVICRELLTIFPMDSCYIAVCDLERPDRFRTALLYDEGSVEYASDVEFGPQTGRLIRERQAFRLPDLNAVRDPAQLGLTTFGNVQKLSRAWMGVPLMLGPDAIGVISLQSYTPDRFSDDDLALLQLIGQVVAVALENASLIQQQRTLSVALASRVAARTEELDALSGIAAEMVLRQPLPALLDRALGLILPLLDVRGGNVRLYDRGRDALVLLAQRGIPPDDARAVPEISVSGSRIGAIVRENRPVMVERDLIRHALKKDPSVFESLLGVPLRIGETVIGSMVLLDTRPRAFEPHQVDLVQLIGNQLAIAIENAQLLDQRERQIRELRALGAISQAANTSLNLRMLLRQVYEALRDLMEPDAFVMSIYDPQRQVIVEGIGIDEGETYEYHRRNRPLPAGSFSGWVVRNRRALHLRDVAEDIGAYPELASVLAGSGRPAASWLGAPLLDRDDQAIGTIVVQSYRPRAFSEQDERFLTRVAQQAALHVRNVILLAQRERQIRELDAIGRVGRLVSASFDLDAMLRIAYENLEQVTGAAAFYLAICEPGSHIVRQVCYIERGQRFDDDWPGAPPPPESLTGWILRSRRPLIFGDLLGEGDRLAELGIAPVFMQNTVQPRSWVGVPLLAEDTEPIGVISVQDEEPYRYDDQTVELLAQVASHLSLGVQKIDLFQARERQIRENERLFAEAEAHAAAAERQAQRMALIHRVSLLLNRRLDPEEILSLAVAELVKLFGVEHGGIMLFEDEGGAGRIVAEYPPGAQRGRSIAGVDRAVFQRLADERRPLVVASVADSGLPEDVRAMLLGSGIQAAMMAPLIIRDQVIGSIGVDSVGAPRAFSAEEQESFMTVAAAVAAAYENARLFAAEHAARRTADTLREVARVLSSTFDASEVLDLILDQLRTVIAYDSASIMLAAGDMLRAVAERGLGHDPRVARSAFTLEGRTAAAMVVGQRQPVLIADTARSPDWQEHRFGKHVRAWLGVPLMSKGRVLGVLNIDSREPGRFTARDVEVALAFANHAAVALENAQLYEDSVARVEQELEIARRIQSNLFPRELPRVPGLRLAARALPARETGGDFYDIVALGPQRFGLLVGDASGKSIPGAMLMAVARSTARSEARDHELPETVMRETNRWIAVDVPKRAFVALCYASLDAARMRLAFANAGQLAPLRRRADGAVDYLEVPGPTLPLGIDPETPYAASEVALAPGDTLVFYTDGIVEAHNPARELFGFARLEALVAASGGGEPEALIEAVLAAVAEFSGPAPQHDDMTLVVLQVEA